MEMPTTGTMAALALDAQLPFDAQSEPYEMLGENLRLLQTHRHTSGIRGRRARHHTRVCVERRRVAGSIRMQPSADELDRLLPRILGAVPQAGEYHPAETLPEFHALIDRGPARFTYAGCKVARAVFRAAAGGPLALELVVEGRQEIVGDGAGNDLVFPALPLEEGTPYGLSDATLRLQAAERELLSFELVIDNVLAVGRYVGSPWRASLPATDRLVTLTVELPYTPDEADLYEPDIVGAAGSLRFATEDRWLEFTLANLKSLAESPRPPARRTRGCA